MDTTYRVAATAGWKSGPIVGPFRTLSDAECALGAYTTADPGTLFVILSPGYGQPATRTAPPPDVFARVQELSDQVGASSRRMVAAGNVHGFDAPETCALRAETEALRTRLRKILF